ncbi:cytochrome P450 93A3-like isoform X2 [Coffea arabica]|uniref:Cytochrome P450 93A3-like isoform X2 n=1 Tax=Coffea arabica TaxID=13443 RepID=A0A6P6SVF9_COFAR|nr:cytochrome P450 93A3-like [Coffea arabica]
MANFSNALFYGLLFFIWFAATTFFRYVLKKRKNGSKPVRHPPSPPSLPIIGHLHLLGSIASKSFQTLANQYGPLIRLRIVSSTVVVVSNAAVAKEFLKNNEMNFVSRPQFGAADFNIYAGSEFVNAEYGPYWRFMKKLCMTELLSVPQVNRFVDIRRQEMMKLLEILVSFSEEGKACNLGVELMTMTNNVVSRMAMSTRCTPALDESKLLWEFVKEILELAPKFALGELFGPIGKFDLFGYGKRAKALISKFDSLVEKIMVEHEDELNSSSKERKDMMDILLEIHRDKTAEVKLSRTDIKSFLMELFMAGTETVSVALTWTLAELINHPKVFQQLRDEINAVVGSKRRVQESDVPKLLYLQAVVKESLRLHAPAPLIFRRCGEDCKINGYDILANERVAFNVFAIMKDPSSWDNPLEFQPERFMVGSKGAYDDYQMDIKGQNFNIFPFGSGRRGCPGASLALAVVHSAVALLVQCFDFRVQGGEKINIEEGSGLSAGLAHPLMCYVTPHLNPLELVVNEAK